MLKTFLNDEDGLSAKDYLMLVFSTVYVIFLVVCFLLSLKGSLPQQTVDILNSMNTIMVTIIGGVFAVQVANQFGMRIGGTTPYGSPIATTIPTMPTSLPTPVTSTFMPNIMPIDFTTPVPKEEIIHEQPVADRISDRSSD